MNNTSIKKSDSSYSYNKTILKRFMKNKLAMFGLIVLVVLILVSILAPLLTKQTTSSIDLYNLSSKPSAEHLLGTDDLGRDVFARLVYGGRVSLGVGIIATLIQVIIGIIVGSIAGYFGGIVDSILMRIVDIVMCFPFFIMAITLAALVGPSVINLIIIIAVLTWTDIARIVRAEVLSVKKREFIEAADALGLNHFQIIVKHILPNVLSPILVAATLGIASAILTEAGLSFLGMGVKPPTPSWGNMLSAAQNMRVLKNQWWLWMPPGLMIFLTVLSINFLGDGLRDALDPKEKV